MSTILHNVPEVVRDALIEVANIGTGRAAAAMSELLGNHVVIEVPSLEFFHFDPAASIAEFREQATVQIIQEFESGLQGRAVLILSKQGAIGIADRLLDEELNEEAFGPTAQSAILELGNILIGGLTGSLGNVLEISISYAPPEIQVRGDEHLLIGSWQRTEPLGIIVKAALRLEGCDISSYLAIVLSEESFHFLTQKLQDAV